MKKNCWNEIGKIIRKKTRSLLVQNKKKLFDKTRTFCCLNVQVETQYEKTLCDRVELGNELFLGMNEYL
jgi:hypothetical protein